MVYYHLRDPEPACGAWMRAGMCVASRETYKVENGRASKGSLAISMASRIEPLDAAHQEVPP